MPLVADQGLPVYVLPYCRSLTLPTEDGLPIPPTPPLESSGGCRLVVVLLPHMSNFSDVESLSLVGTALGTCIHLSYGRKPDDLQNAHIIVLPGSKSVISDLCYLQGSGMVDALREVIRVGKVIVVGLCGGFQMLGHSIEDPEAVETEFRFLPGLRILPVTTVLQKEKVVRQRKFHFLPSGDDTVCDGYEIHMGVTTPLPGHTLTPIYRCLSTEGDPITGGVYLTERCWGSYMHGILDNVVVMRHLLDTVGLETHVPTVSVAELREGQFDYLADHVRTAIPVDVITGLPMVSTEKGAAAPAAVSGVDDSPLCPT